MQLSLPDFKQQILLIRRISRILWVRVAVISVLSLIAALSAELIDPLVPAAPKERFNQDTTLPVLNILASGMLAVVTFSLGVMVSSHRSLASSTTPRIHRLLMEDSSTQSMLATFIGSFVFSLASIILFRAGYYSDSAAVVVFGLVVLLVAAIVYSLIRWIHKLSRIGTVDYALERAETTAKKTLETHRETPNFGARILPSEDDIPDSARPVRCSASGYLMHLNIASLRSVAEKIEARIWVVAIPGDRVLSGQILAYVENEPEDVDDLREAFEIGRSRSYDQDPRYALQALRETATKALSPGINDPGTAVEVVTRLEILLHDHFRSGTDAEEDGEGKVFVTSIRPGDLIETAFRDIARDGAGFVDVLTSIGNALRSMMEAVENDDARASIERLEDELSEHAEKMLRTEAERERFRNRSVGERSRNAS